MKRINEREESPKAVRAEGVQRAPPKLNVTFSKKNDNGGESTSEVEGEGKGLSNEERAQSRKALALLKTKKRSPLRNADGKRPLPPSSSVSASEVEESSADEGPLQTPLKSSFKGSRD